MIVVDTNIITYFYLPTPYSERAERLFEQDSQWCAPSLWRSEFRNVLALYLRKELITLEEAFEILENAELMMEDHEFYLTSRHILTLVDSSSCSAYDCEFVALAEQLNLKLVTEDQKILFEFGDRAINIDTFLKK